MKKHSLLKALGIIFLIFVILSFIIPTGYYSNGEFVKDQVASIGLFDIFLNPMLTILNFSLIGFVFLTIGAYYGVLNKTKAYPRFVENIAKKLKGKEKTAIVITTVFFVLISAFTSLSIPLFALVPLFAAILMSLGHSKFNTMLSTVGGILIGNVASIYGSTIGGYTKYVTSDINAAIWIKLILLLVSIIALIVFILLTSKSKEKEPEIMLYSKTTKKVSTVPFIVLFILTFIIAIVAMISWEGIFGIKLFTDIHNAVMGVKLGNVEIFSKILGSVPALGTWTNYEFIVLLVISGLIIAKVYKIKFKEIIEGAKEGMKEILPVALVALIANVILYLAYANSSGYGIYPSILNRIMPNSFNSIRFGFATVIGSVIYNDFAGYLSIIWGAVINYKSNYVLICMISQTIHGLVQLIVPTSVILAAGLTYFKIPYVDYLKKIWKLLLCLLVITIILLIFV